MPVQLAGMMLLTLVPKPVDGLLLCVGAKQPTCRPVLDAVTMCRAVPSKQQAYDIYKSSF